MPEPVVVILSVLALAALLVSASGLVWIVILTRCVCLQPILPFEPRSPVPWGAGASLLAVIMTLMAVWNFVSGAEQPNLEDLSSLEMAKQVAELALLTLLITTIAVTLVGITFRASWADFGMPGRIPDLIRDVIYGGLAWLASLIPVFGTQTLLTYLLGQPSGHPLLKMLMQEPSSALIAAIFLAAVIIAPICEELAFRLLLQSCLENWETARVTATPVSLDRGVGGLPYGWVPIGVSSLLFALAHLGHGPDPVAIFFLAIILGYTYHQTHRILPCIIAHMLFNALSLGIVLMEILNHQGGP